MKDIIRIQLRQMLTQRVVYISTALIAATIFLVMFLNSGDIGETPKTATEFLPQVLHISAGIAFFVGAALIGFGGGADFLDKTINHEAMAGKSRAAIYFGRAIPALILTPVFVIAVSILPFLPYAMINDWGDTIPASVLIQRCVLALFPLLRLCSFAFFLMFIFRHPNMPILIAFPCFAATMGSAADLTPLPFFELIYKIPCLLSFGNLNDLLSFDYWFVNNLNFDTFYTYYFSLDTSYIIQTVVISLVMSAVYLLLGYHFFHLDDMN